MSLRFDPAQGLNHLHLKRLVKAVFHFEVQKAGIFFMCNEQPVLELTLRVEKIKINIAATIYHVDIIKNYLMAIKEC